MAKPLAKLLSVLTPKRRWAQFSLATMFVVVTALCVGLSLVVAPAERQRRAVAAIEAIGSVEYAQGASEAFPKPLLRRWLPWDYFDDVREVYLFDTQITDAEMAHLPGLTRLEWLDLDETRVTDAGVAHLRGMTSLKRLCLSGTPITDAGLPHLYGLTGLEIVTFFGTQLTDEGLAKLQQALPKCRICFTPKSR